eukprot:15334034-Ditylum_brightwellii.AAC.1
MMRMRNSTGELDEMVPGNEKGLMLMDALCGLHEEDTDNEDSLSDWNFLAFDEGGHSDETTDYEEFEEFECLDLDYITGNKKSEHLNLDQHAGFGKGNWL